MEVPAPAERAHGRRDAEARPADDLDAHGPVRPFRVRRRDLVRVHLLVRRVRLRARYQLKVSGVEGGRGGGRTILSFAGRSTQSWSPRGSGTPGPCTGISACMTGGGASARNIVLISSMAVRTAFAGGHPLHAAWEDRALVSCGVFMLARATPPHELHLLCDFADATHPSSMYVTVACPRCGWSGKPCTSSQHLPLHTERTIRTAPWDTWKWSSMRNGVRLRSFMLPIERRTSAPAPCRHSSFDE